MSLYHLSEILKKVTTESASQSVYFDQQNIAPPVGYYTTVNTNNQESTAQTSTNNSSNISTPKPRKGQKTNNFSMPLV